MAELRLNRKARFVPEGLLGATIVFLVLARFIPANPPFIGDWLDAGWVWGVNYAYTHAFRFGRDLVFNYGPYSVVATHIYDPGSRTAMIGGSLVLATAFATGLLCIRRPMAALYAVLLLPLVNFSDTLAFAVALPAMLVCAEGTANDGRHNVATIAVLAVSPALALLPLIKGSYLGLSLVDTTVLVLLAWVDGRRWLAAMIVPAVIFMLFMFWFMAGQHISSLPAYFAGTIEIISGYNDAMVTPGTTVALLQALVTCLVFMAFVVVCGWRLPRAVLAILSLGLGATLFIVFKAGYVRADPAHETLTLVSLGWLLSVLSVWLGGKPALVAAGIGLLLLFAGPSSEGGVVKKILALPALLATELGDDYHFFTNPAGLARDAAVALTSVTKLPWQPPGTADIYSYDQMKLLATGLAWDPRPMFQSYSAFTPALAQLNADHLLHELAPDNVFFRIEPIDGRLPSLEDGPSWTALQSLYEPVGYDGKADLAWLRRAAGGQTLPSVLPMQRPQKRSMGEPVRLPSTRHNLWAVLDVRPTWEGRAASLLWQAPLLHITLLFADGRKQSFRLIPGMARAGFLLSPFVASTIDFLKLRSLRNMNSASPVRPVAVTVDSGPGDAWSWQRTYTLELATFDLPQLNNAVHVQNITTPRPFANPPSAPQSTCFLDEVDGGAPPTTPLAAAWPVTLSGWSLFDLLSKQQADETAIMLQDTSGFAYEMPALQGPRADVASALHLQNADRAGFVSMGDLTHLPAGNYTVSIASRHANKTRLCKTSLIVAVAEPR